MKKVFLVLVLTGTLFASPALAALKVDDFIPPVQAASEAEKAELLKIQQPGEIKEVSGDVPGESAISAASAQDALNSWVADQRAGTRQSGYKQMLFPSGFGFVATGVGTYERHDNPAATRIAQRSAYVRAYMAAKGQLTEGLYGYSSSANTKSLERIATVNESMGQTLVDAEELTSEAIQQRVDGFLRGFVVYDVFDDGSARVYVTIVTTPNTQGHYNRPDTASLSAASIQEGLAQVLAEIEQGLTSPVGGMTVFVPATGELAFVGFGSAVIGRQDNAAVQARLELNGERVARVRAKDALCGVVVGETIAMTEGVEDELSVATKDFEQLTQNDPAVKNDPDHPGYVKLQDQKNTFKAAQANQTVITSARQGIMPPGVQQQSWMDEDKAFAYAVAVYIPSVTGLTVEGAETMLEGTILQPIEGQTKPKPAVPEEIKRGPSGTVQNPDAL